MLKSFFTFIKANWAFYVILFCVQGTVMTLMVTGYLHNPSMAFSFIMSALTGFITSIFVLFEKKFSQALGKHSPGSANFRKYAFRMFVFFIPNIILGSTILIFLFGANQNSLSSIPFLIVTTILGELLVGIMYGLIGFWVLDSFSEIKSPFGALFRANIGVLGKCIAWSISIVSLTLALFLFVFFAQDIIAYFLISEQELNDYRGVTTAVFMFAFFVTWDLTVFSFQSFVIATYYRPLYLSKLAIAAPESEVNQGEPGPAEETQP